MNPTLRGVHAEAIYTAGVLRRTPSPLLRPYVAALWASEDDDPAPAATRELVVPTGGMHLAIRLDAPLRIFADALDVRGQIVGHAVVGGARSVAHHRSLLTPSRSVGAQLHPGVATWLFGMPASELAERHTSLHDLWEDAAATRLHDRLLEAPTASARLLVLEAELTSRLAGSTRLHPLVACTLARLHDRPTTPIALLASSAGYTQRRLLDLFRQDVGLAPKRYARLVHLQRALPQLAEGARAIDVSTNARYADESHLHRELREVTGLSVREYRQAAAASPNHVPR